MEAVCLLVLGLIYFKEKENALAVGRGRRGEREGEPDSLLGGRPDVGLGPGTQRLWPEPKADT